MEILTFLREWAGLLNLAIIPAIWWAAKLDTKVTSLHKAFAVLQTHSNKIAVLEHRTGGPIRVDA